MQYRSQTLNKDLMRQARETLRGQWGLAIGVFILYFVIMIVIGYIPKIHAFVSLAVGGPFSLGLAIFTLSLSRRANPEVSQLFSGFQRFITAFAANLLIFVFVLLWSVLLIVPGIIASFAYSMTFYILADNESMGALDAIRKSKEMMEGNKWKYFCLGCRFLGWFFLCLLSLGIGFLWFLPYMSVSYAKFYDDLIAEEEDLPADSADKAV